MSTDNLLVVNILVSIVGTIFNGIIIFIMFNLSVAQERRAEQAAKKTEEVKKTLEKTLVVSSEKMDNLAQESTLKSLEEKAVIVGTDKH